MQRHAVGREGASGLEESVSRHHDSGAVTACAAADQHSVPRPDSVSSGENCTAETDAGSIDIDAVTFSVFHDFCIPCHNGDTGGFRLFCDGGDNLFQIGEGESFFQYKGQA